MVTHVLNESFLVIHQNVEFANRIVNAQFKWELFEIFASLH